ncbi:hypothetical protein GCM10022243_43460 [Saccharothrix violaceirubra]|uniref:Uncharacterized protein n=1 Tax=Saccharothrix violaceirubra TaxID=413306 RepID=A0A7W7T311_9PSEU|nr:hypothetical protein [Saccharothrix violaceirubra]MBB4965633.1 hypothetical protein [Saccharothrix violaceirubra]
MHENDSRRALANPRRTRLAADWTAQSVSTATDPRPAPHPEPEARSTDDLN